MTKPTVRIGRIVTDEAAQRGAIELLFLNGDGRTGELLVPYQPKSAAITRQSRGVARLANEDLHEPTFVCGLILHLMGLRLHVRISRGTLQLYGDSQWQLAPNAAEAQDGPVSDAEPEGDTLADGSPDTPQGREELREAAESGGVDDEPDPDFQDFANQDPREELMPEDI